MPMMEGAFIDRVKLRLKAGDGGNGAVSFRHEKYVPLGGPDGGDGGRGGSIILRINPGLNTLEKLHSQPFYKAENAHRGGKNNRSGANGEDFVLESPPGTVVYDADTRELIVDMEETNGEYVIARGGAGGKGNARFATPTNQAPRKTTPGKPGEELTALFELKLVAHAGLIGLPNAGKSTLISSITAARPRIADYPFTTLQPILGAVPLEDDSSLVIADIPGIIQGAHSGVGLGLEFLRHIERTKMLVYVIEVSPHDPDLPAVTLKDLRHEIQEYDAAILQRPSLIALNKIDLLDDEEEIQLVWETFHRHCPDIPRDSIFLISALQKKGTNELKERIVSTCLEQMQSGAKIRSEEQGLSFHP
ncbi:MAG: GTPase ObgE [Candidatus Omnitrophota bacterium]